MPFFRNVAMRVIGFTGLALFSALVQADITDKAVSHHTATKQWVSDGAMKEGMESIRNVVHGKQTEITESRLDSAGYRRLAVSIDQIAGVISNDQSKSDKELRRAFHTIVMGDLRWGIEMMRSSPKIDVQRLGALSVLQALRNYGQFFVHPGWGAIR